MNCPLEMVEEITHNTKIFTFKLPGASHMVIPTGHHIRIKGKDQEGSYICAGKVLHLLYRCMCAYSLAIFIIIKEIISCYVGANPLDFSDCLPICSFR